MKQVGRQPGERMASLDPVRKRILYGAFKGMGDLVSALPVILSELGSGAEVTLLVFPQIQSFIELIDFGPMRARLELQLLPVAGGPGLLSFLRDLSRLSPDLVWISPHAPAPASSWKIPGILWLAKRLYWPKARLAGASSERCSWLFNERAAVDRKLPFTEREWQAYFSIEGNQPPQHPPTPSFKGALHEPRLQLPAFDLLIHPGAGARNRRWPAAHFAELLRHIPTHYRIAVVGLPEDVALMKAVLPDDRGICFLTGSLEDSITSIARTRVALTMDSGNMFFANVLGVPTVALFGASNPANVISAGGSILPVYEEKWPCQPCGSSRCTQKAVYCMDSIEPAHVAERIVFLMEKAVE